MLIGIPSLLPPELLKIMMEMGHGDELVLADANFPAARIAKRLVRCDGHAMPQVLDAVLRLYPLDSYVPKPAFLMEVVPGDPVETPIWDTYASLIRQRSGLTEPFATLDRFAFYERASQAYAVVATGERAQYANLILKKGVIVGDAD